MEAYAKSTAPLTDYYEQRDLLVAITADGAPEAIFQRTAAALRKRG